MHNNKRQEGAALLMALLIVAIVAVIAAGLLTREHFIINRTISLDNDAKMRLAATLTQNWASAELKTPQYKQTFPLTMATAHVQNLTIHATLIDMQGRFNINNLSGGTQQAYFIKLLQTVDSNVNDDAAKKLAQAVSDWTSPPGHESVFDKIYEQSSPPYRAAHQLMVSVSELRLVAGVDATIYNSLAPYLSALPKQKTAVNINTASVPVLMTIASNMDVSTAQQIVEERQNNPFKTVGDFQQFSPVKQLKIDTDLTTQSDYFLLVTQVSDGSQQLYLDSLLQRQSSHDSVISEPLWQVRSLG